MPTKKPEAKRPSEAAAPPAGRPGWLQLLPPLIACVALLLMVARMWSDGAYYTAGHFTYALDDAYIHMAISKNLALHGVLGATPFEFTSASSSPLWTLLLAAAFKVFGVKDLIPLVMGTLASLGLLVVSDFVMRKLGVGTWWRLVALLWICVAAPLIAIVYGGMEHPLQILIDVGFLYVAALLIQRDDVAWDRLAVVALALAAAATAVRYEGILLVAVVTGALLLRRRWSTAAAIAAAGAAPIATYGLVSLSQGAFFFPNSVLVKTSDNLVRALLRLDLGAYIQQLVRQPVFYLPYLLVVVTLVLLYLQARAGIPKWDARFILPALAVAVAIPHLTLGQLGWFFRYEAYLMVLLAIGIAVQLSEIGREAWDARGSIAIVWVIAVVFAVAAFGSGISRGWAAWQATPRAMENVYEQMYQTAHFLMANPQYDSVAVGDLGAVAYFNDNLRILDLEGLAERGEPLGTIGRHQSTAKDIARRAKQDGSKIAIVFPDYFDLPSDWVEVARWKISNNIVAYADTVAFLAIPPTNPAELAAAVRKYSIERLPKTVGAQGLPIPPPAKP